MQLRNTSSGASKIMHGGLPMKGKSMEHTTKFFETRKESQHLRVWPLEGGGGHKCKLEEKTRAIT